MYLQTFPLYSASSVVGHGLSVLTHTITIYSSSIKSTWSHRAIYNPCSIWVEGSVLGAELVAVLA